jgi:A/G-specific adenine glycosylase
MTATFGTPKATDTHAPLAAWYAHHGRHHLPWRATRNPYAVLVSEVMLQQTQVDRVIPHYHRWLERWPGFAPLARAPAAEVITAWRGLGYNRRALALHAAARSVVEQHGGTLPWDPVALRALPGVGPYTASALRCFVRDEPVAVLDTNIRRVIARLRLGCATAREAPPARIEEAATALLPCTGARNHNLALMDLGAMVCTAREPACDRCPLERRCAWRAAGSPRPSTAAGRPAPPFELTARFARGRIVDLLRGGPARRDEIAASLPEVHRLRLDVYLASLERDGLVSPVGECAWALPEANRAPA